MKWAVVTDFDSTITTFDVGDDIVMAFKAAGKKQVEGSYAPGVAVEKWMSEVFGRLAVCPDDLKRHVIRNAETRKKAVRFIKYCREKNIPVEIVSGGLDVYAFPLLAKWKIDVKKYFGRAVFAGTGYLVEYPFLKKRSLCDFKADRVRYYQARGYKVLFMGDGTSDYNAACAADVVFSRQRLYQICRAKGTDTNKLTDFSAPLDFLSSKAQ